MEILQCDIQGKRVGRNTMLRLSKLLADNRNRQSRYQNQNSPRQNKHRMQVNLEQPVERQPTSHSKAPPSTALSCTTTNVRNKLQTLPLETGSSKNIPNFDVLHTLN